MSPADLNQLTAERDGLRAVISELLRLLDEHELLPAARHRLDALDRGNGNGNGNPA